MESQGRHHLITADYIEDDFLTTTTAEMGINKLKVKRHVAHYIKSLISTIKRPCRVSCIIIKEKISETNENSKIITKLSWNSATYPSNAAQYRLKYY
ncbi:hypothetical protein ElyMa_002445000 [Elysia marginata]|uniref:Uncharacterized protein n=1 Tax=Elysia marginata TaxID=1093978 RepID=A0AAV4GJF6_9GAST|nr:hypothetical protein ElyMa_002445000 [Elysia marginata]